MSQTRPQPDRSHTDVAASLVATFPACALSDERLVHLMSVAFGDSDEAVDAVFSAMQNAGWTLGLDAHFNNVYWPPDEPAPLIA